MYRYSFAVLLTLVTGAAVHAHHSSAIYYKDQMVSASGVVTEWYTGRPHFYLEFVGTDPSGDERTYRVDFGGRSAMVRGNEWDDSTFSPGDRVTVSGNPSRANDRDILVDTLEADFGRFSGEAHGATAAASIAAEGLQGGGMGGGGMGAGGRGGGGQRPGVSLPVIQIVGTVTGSDWVAPNAVIHVHGAADNQAARDYEILLTDPATMLEFAYITAEDATPGMHFAVLGFLSEAGDRATIIPQTFEIGDRGTVIFARFTQGLVAEFLGREPAGDAIQ